MQSFKDIKWRHFSHESSLVLDKDKIYRQEIGHKPTGFWLSYENEWLVWSQDAGYDYLDEEAYQYDVEFLQDTNIIIIATFEDLVELVNNYKKVETDCIEFIDWTRIQQEYDGVIFLNYLNIKIMVRNKLMFNSIRDISRGNPFLYIWYMGLDCSCACIFNTNIINIINKSQLIL
jgi:hypothetical protein